MKSKFIRIASLLCAGAMFLSGCGQQVVEVSEWQEGEGTTQQVQHSSGNKDQTVTSTQTTSANFELSDKEGVSNETSTGKTYNLNGADVVISSHGGSEPKPGTDIYKVKTDIESKYNCKIVYKIHSSSMGYYSAFATAAQAGTKFSDIAMQSTAVVYRKQFKMGYWAPLGDFLNTKEAIFNQSARQSMEYEGKDYVVVMANRWYAVAQLYFNRAIFKKFGEKTPDEYVDSNTWTVDNFLALAKRLTKTDGGTKYWGFALDTNTIKVFGGMYGGKTMYIDKNGKRIYDPDANYIAGIQFASDLVWKHEVSPTSLEHGNTALKKGTTAMGHADTWHVAPIMEAIGAENLGCTWYPRGENAKHSASVGETTCWGVPATADKKNWEAYGQILRDYNYPYRWQTTLREQSEGIVGDEKSIQTIMEMTKTANENMKLGPLYDYISKTIDWSDFGIGKQQSPQAYFDSVKAGAQAELDAFWEQ